VLVQEGKEGKVYSDDGPGEVAGEAPSQWWPSTIYALGDIHGDAMNTLLLLHAAGVVNSSAHWIAKDALLIQTGDIVDRGPDSRELYEYFMLLDTQARQQGGRLVQLLGNHEALNLCNVLVYVSPAEFETYGGAEQRALEFSERGEIGRKLRSLDSAVVYNDILFVHAGLLPKFAQLGLDAVNEGVRRELGAACSVEGSVFTGERGPLWDRVLATSAESRACPLLDQTLAAVAAKRMVVGHTVTQSGRIELRCDGKLVKIDGGLSRYIMNRPVLLEIRAGDGWYQKWLEVNATTRQPILHTQPLPISDGDTQAADDEQQRQGSAGSDESTVIQLI